jgi:hypothetical protein
MDGTSDSAAHRFKPVNQIRKIVQQYAALLYILEKHIID